MTADERAAIIAGIAAALQDMSPWLLRLEARRHGVGEPPEEYSEDAGRPWGDLEGLGRREGSR